ncbi:MAG: hypothetical protein GXY38_10330 [Planctomycetes bacterium]|jgi:hypothetical protein|nr:hypothetical protein [Planctomycetota bacterium]
MNARLLMAPLLCCVFVGGCGRVARDDAGFIMPQASPPIQDVPIPVGFRYVDGESYDASSRGVRTISHTYSGRADKFETKQFFRNQMPQSGWGVTSDISFKGVLTLMFAKGSETCRVMIQDSGLFGGCEVEIQIHPNVPTKGP